MQGAIEDGEQPREAVISKLREETGIVSAEVIDEVCAKEKNFSSTTLSLTSSLSLPSRLKFPNWLTYDFPPSVKAKVNRLWGGEWHGQAQKWSVPLWPFRLLPSRSEVLAIGKDK